MPKAVHVFVGSSELIGYTSLKLTRKKEDCTGQVEIDLFMGYLPNQPILDSIVRGVDIYVYIGGNLAFSGSIDRRVDSGTSKPRESGDVNIESYKVRIVARGSAKGVVDACHTHPTGTFLKSTNRLIFEELVSQIGINIDWRAGEIEIERFRLRDGSTILDELKRLAERTAIYFYETITGEIRVVDEQYEGEGEPLVLGQNIMSFRADQLGDAQRSEIVVKGQLSDPASWGEGAVLDKFVDVLDETVPYLVPIVVKAFGDATPELLERRANYEANKRTTYSKSITVETFGLTQSNGDIWELGDTHYVSIPPAGISAEFEITELKYQVDNRGRVVTNITLAPVIQGSQVSSTERQLLSDLPSSAERVNREIDDGLASAWLSTSPKIQEVTEQITNIAGDELLVDLPERTIVVPLKLPSNF